MELIDSKVPPPSFELRKRRVQAAAQRIAERIDGIHDAGADANDPGGVRELIAEKRFPIRVYMMLGDDENC